MNENSQLPSASNPAAWDRSIVIGLADALGRMDFVAREVITTEQIIDFTEEDYFSESFARRLGTNAADSFWSRLLLSGSDAGSVRGR